MEGFVKWINKSHVIYEDNISFLASENRIIFENSNQINFKKIRIALDVYLKGVPFGVE